MTPDSVLTSYAPTEYSTGSGLNAAGSGLERLLNIAIGGYSAVTSAKNANTAQKIALAEANKSGVTAPTAPADGGLALNGRTLVLGAGILAAGIVAVALLRK